MKLKTFKIGGVHPPENKMAASTPIEALAIPKRVSIPLSQHIGAPAVPVVKKGDDVKVGTLIAKGESFISANIHSSVSGRVFAIDTVTDTTGYKVKAVIIDVEGDVWDESIIRTPELAKEIKLEPADIVAKIKSSGIVGLGGACFPTHVKFMVPEGKKVDTLVINAVECEPYLTADHRIMLERTEEILVGIEIMKKALKVSRAIVGIEANKPDAIAKMEKVASDFPGTEIQPLKVQYPQGAEKQLIKAALNREVPSGKLPLDVGCVVNNVGTALAIYEAVQKNKPLFERVVTVTGKKIKRTANFLVRIGTPVEALVEAVGGIPEGTEKIVNGGPMMGKAVVSPEISVTKGTSGIIFFDKSEAKRKKVSNCIRCAKCVTVCAMGLQPYLLEKLAEKNNWEELEKLSVTDCIECGSCSYTCPSARPILDLIRLGKANVNRIRWERSKK
ncbi:MAG TPA: electron transport complex subunit RsxC [bacterium]|nr:electron transport complex subunit RsxC [bacterium]HPM47554.1 electron transport complex subunit RsxC [bacterium]HRQ69021.1 electron transport complex subunit RsxC [bacterium]